MRPMMIHRHFAIAVLACMSLWLAPVLPAAAQEASANSSAPASTAESAATTPRPRILITNDDGIDSPALSALVDVLRPFADVVVSAPATNQSGMSQANTIFHNPTRVNLQQDSNGVLRITVYGTPVDAALYALTSQPRFNLVISGINKGYNFGALSWISGTVGAARMAALMGVPAIAVSQDKSDTGYDFSLAARYTAQLARYAVARPDRWPMLVSVNVPTTPTAVAMTRTEAAWPLHYDAPREVGRDASGDALYQLQYSLVAAQDKKGDRVALAEQKITVSILSLDPNGKKQKLPLMLLSLPDAR